MKIIHLLHAIIFLACVHPLLHAAKPAWAARTAARTQHVIGGVSRSKIIQAGATAVFVAGTAISILAAYDNLVTRNNKVNGVGCLFVAAALCMHTVNYPHFIKPLLHSLATSKKMADKP